MSHEMANGDSFNELRRYARSLEAEVDPSASRRAAAVAMMTAGPSRRRHRLVPALGAATALVLGNAGLAVATDPAIPGDALYSVDRFYEEVTGWAGFGGDVRDERLAEATALNSRGDLAAALYSASEAVSGLGDDGNGLAIADSAEVLRTSPSQEWTADLHEETDRLLDLAKDVVEAAQSGDPGAAGRAAEAMEEQAAAVWAAAHRQGRDDRGRGQGQDDRSQGQEDELGQGGAQGERGDRRQGDRGDQGQGNPPTTTTTRTGESGFRP